jgi:hypothetical protein
LLTLRSEWTLRPRRANVPRHEDDDIFGHVFDDHVDSLDICVDYEVVVFLELELDGNFVNG